MSLRVRLLAKNFCLYKTVVFFSKVSTTLFMNGFFSLLNVAAYLI
jgi:hypothetical protein